MSAIDPSEGRPSVVGELVATPKGWVESFGDLTKFAAQVVREVLGLRVFRFFGEALRQSGILIVSSTLVILRAWISRERSDAVANASDSIFPS